MVETAARVIWYRWRPREGWLPSILLAAVIILSIAAVHDTQWAPEAGIVVPSALLGLLMGSLLAKRNTDWRLAWSILLGYGFVFNILWLIRSAASGSSNQGSSTVIGAGFRQNWAVFVERIQGWTDSVSQGGISEETITFVLLLGLTAWLLSAYASWSIFRQRQPLRGLIALGFALGFNAFFGRAPLWPLPLFVGLSVLLIVTFQFSRLESGWVQRHIDYPDDVRFDFFIIGAGTAMGLLILAFFVPSVDIKAASAFFGDLPVVQGIEDSLERLFAGVNQPGEAPAELGAPGTGGAGGLPTTMLVGDPPELYETVVMTATVSAAPEATVHWRGASFDIYTGHGWSISDEREELIEAGAAILVPLAEKRQEIDQTVNWALGRNAQRYSLGLPLRFNQEVNARWRDADDLSRVSGEENFYQVQSQVPTPSAEELRSSSVDGVPAPLMARYTQLPEDLPERVVNLAQDVAGDSALHPTRYDQVKAIEQFLRQYPYTLDVELPGSSDDVVDFFLFELQKGYCDYYASAMVVMARILGIPSRLGTGFNTQPPEGNGEQVIFQINAHSWAEVYFEEYGWVEFEPTAAFPIFPHAQLNEADLDFDIGAEGQEYEPHPIPQKAEDRFPAWWAFLGLVLAVPLIYGLILRRRSRKNQPDPIQRAYARLQNQAVKLGQTVPPSQTPDEFRSSLSSFISRFSDRWYSSYLQPSTLSAEIRRLTTAFEVRQYGRRTPPGEPAERAWRFIRTRLMLLRLATRLDFYRRR